MRPDDEDGRPGEGGRSGGDPSWIDALVVPDDLSELDAEVRALQRERRSQARRQRLRRLLRAGRRRRLTAPVVIAALLLVAGFASLIVLFQPRRQAPAPVPLATNGARGTGRVDGLLPDLSLVGADGSRRALRDQRPAVLALAPGGCDCDQALRDVGTAAGLRQVPFLLVDRTVPPLPAGLTDRAVTRFAEPTGVLARTYGAEEGGTRRPGGPVLVLVSGDGVVKRVLPAPPTQRVLDGELAVLALTGSVPGR